MLGNHEVELVPAVEDLVAPGQEGLKLGNLEQAKLLLLMIQDLDYSISASLVSIPDTETVVQNRAEGDPVS